MTEIATVLWWWLPTAAISCLLMNRVSNGAQRWPIALALWLAATGVLGTMALSFGLPLNAVRAGAFAILLVSAVILYHQRKKSSNSLENFEQLVQENAPFAPQVFMFLAIAALLLIGGTLAWNVLNASAGSAEFFAYSASARSAVIEGGASANLHNGALHSFAAQGVVAFPVAVQYVSAAISGVWALWAAKLPYALIWAAGLTLALGRLREARVPLVGSVSILLLVLLLPSLVTLTGRGSDFAWIAGCALAAASAWLTPQRNSVALLFSALAFAWNPWLGWPLALTSAVFAIAGSVRAPLSGWILRIFVGAAFIFMMLVLQGETFLPTAMRAWFRPTLETPLWGQHGLWQAGAVVACALAILAGLTIFARSRSSVALKWYFGFALLSVIASLKMMPSALGATDGALDLALTLFAPALVMVSLSSVGQHIYALSGYQGIANVTLKSATEITPDAQPQTEGIVDATPEPLLDHQQMRDQLLKAYERFGQGELAGASDLAKEVLASDENHPDAHHLLALIALQENRPGDALRAVQRAIDVFPEHPLFFLTVADIYGTQERWAEQADALSTASKLDPSDVATKTKLVLAKRKALMAQAAAQVKMAQSAATDGGGYEIQIAAPPKRN
jgi:tetratricopeptide (TPR) repeat protein